MILKKGDLFITIEESDLVNLVKQVIYEPYLEKLIGSNMLLNKNL